MLKVGINNDVTLNEVSYDTNAKCLIFSFGEKKNLIEALSGVEGFSGNNAVRLWAPADPSKFSNPVENLVDFFSLQLDDRKKVAFQILEQFIPKGDIDIDMLKGLDVNEENISKYLSDYTSVLRIWENFCSQYVRAITAAPTDKKLRLLLVRQSKLKAFATFRQRFVDAYPFVEPMDIPIEESKLKFTAYEITNGLDSNAPIEKPKTEEPVDVDEISELFK